MKKWSILVASRQNSVLQKNMLNFTDSHQWKDKENYEFRKRDLLALNNASRQRLKYIRRLHISLILLVLLLCIDATPAQRTFTNTNTIPFKII